MNNLTIRVINTGTAPNTSKAAVNYLSHNYDDKFDLVYPMFLIEGGEQKILVDTGVCDPEFMRKYHGHEFVRKPDEWPLEGLRKVGVAPEDIRIIINTHLHYDHCHNNHLFPNAKILVQRKELAFAISPLPSMNVIYEIGIEGVSPPWLKSLNNMIAVDGEMEVIPGVRLIPLPGHTPGLQGVLVDTAKGKYLLGSDMAYLWESWYGNALMKHIPPTQHVNVEECLTSAAYAEKIADIVLPSHDPDIVEQGIYPL